MPEWDDNGVVLSSRPFGEDAAVVSVLTERHGRHAGLIRGGQSRKLRPVLQAGNRVAVNWRARLDEHLGSMTVEPVSAHAALIMENRFRLAGLASLCAVLSSGTAEREPVSRLYEATIALIDRIASESEDIVWLAVYVHWELGLLAEAGFGLKLDRCGVSGAGEGLCYVSPRTGVAVTAEAAGEHIPRLLILPGFLGGEAKSLEEDVINGIRMTGHFITRQIFAPHHRPVAEARQRLERMVVARYGSAGGAGASEPSHLQDGIGTSE